MISQQELQEIAEKCRFKPVWEGDCALCEFYGEGDTFSCCAYCVKYPTCELGQGIAETRCKREYDEETAKREKVPTPV